MPQEIPKLRVTFFNGRNVFPSILCKECERFPTQHRCLFDVTKHVIYLMVVKYVVQLSAASVPAHLAMKGFLLVQSIQAQKKTNVLL
jgi:hypothetical protein